VRPKEEELIPDLIGREDDRTGHDGLEREHELIPEYYGTSSEHTIHLGI